VSLLAESAMVVAERLVSAAVWARCLAALLALAPGLPAVWRAAAKIGGGRAGCDGVDRSGDGGDRGLACTRIPDGVGVVGHVGSGLVVSGSQMVPHGGGQPQQEQRQKNRVVATRPCREERQHLIHQC
jgi:hypothetical protein